MKIAISLVWIRHKVAGGVESFTRNLLDGFRDSERDNKYILICSQDNADSFKHYADDGRFEIYVAPVVTSNLKQTIWFENFKLDGLVTRLGADICFVPCYRMPLLQRRNKYVVVVHDIISCHFPEHFKGFRAKWLNFATKRACKIADKLITISNYVQDDLKRVFHLDGHNMMTIYNPILPYKEVEDFSAVEADLGLQKEKYFYTVSSLAFNKNLKTLVRLMAALKDDPKFKDYKLVVSGVGLNNPFFASAQKDLFEFIEQQKIADNIIFTGFVSNERRNSLIVNSAFFLFASIFEGFGMPIIEAMEFGARVITTKCASLYEVSEGKAVYVDDPYDVQMWVDAINENVDTPKAPIHFGAYEIERTIKNYLDLFESVGK